MEREESITKIERQKGAHLTFKERVVIQTRKKDGYSARKIAREIGCSHVSVGVRKNFCKKGIVHFFVVSSVARNKAFKRAVSFGKTLSPRFFYEFKR